MDDGEHDWRAWLLARTGPASTAQGAVYLRRLRHTGARLSPWLLAVVEAPPPPTAWPALLEGVLRGLLELPARRGRRAFLYLMESIVSLGGLDLLERVAREPANGKALEQRIPWLIPRCSASLRQTLAQQVPGWRAFVKPPPDRPVPSLSLPAIGQVQAVRAWPGISIITVMHGRPFQLHRLLASIGLLGAAMPLEVLVFANGKTVAEEAAMARLLGGAATLRVFRTDTPLPIGVARNRLIAEARYETILSLDSDMVLLQPVERICPGYASFPAAMEKQFWNLGAFALRDLCSLKLVRYVEPVAPTDGALNLLRNRSLLRLSPAALEAATAQGQVVASNRTSGGCSIFPRSLFLELGGFCERFDIGWEDLEFSLRLVASGRIVLTPVSVPLFHGHMMPSTAADLRTETQRFAPERFAAGLRVMAEHGFMPERALPAMGSQRIEEADLRRCYFKVALLEGLGLPMVDAVVSGPVVGWVAGTTELAQGPLRAAMVASHSWRNVVFGASEVATLHRLATNLVGCDMIVIGAEAANFLAGRDEPFATAFVELNRRFAGQVFVTGPEDRAATILSSLLPSARVRHLQDDDTPLREHLRAATSPAAM